MARTRYYNATQAAIELGRNEKTIRRWIREGKLKAEHPTPRKLAIPEQEIGRMKSELERLEQYEQSNVIDAGSLDTSSLIARIEQLEQDRRHLASRIEQLERRTRQLEQQEENTSASRETPEPTHTTRPSDSTTQSEPRQKRATERSTEAPEGTIAIKDFAERHGVNPRTFRDHFTKGIKGDIITDVTEVHDTSRNETKRYLTPEQEAKVLDYWTRHNVRYTLPEQEGITQ